MFPLYKQLYERNIILAFLSRMLERGAEIKLIYFDKFMQLTKETLP